MKRKGRPPEGINGMRVRSYPQLAVRIEPPLMRAFKRRLAKMGVPVGVVVSELIRDWNRRH